LANDFFKFKQFTIYQDKCAMKVTSLASIQGAWLPDINPDKILDIGAGTGLLSLMAAQKYKANIDAVEIEADAFHQLSENIAVSPWSDRIRSHHEDIRIFAKENSRTYDLIISNPPFYQNQLKSGDLKINQARHELSLTLPELLHIVHASLAPNGICSILLPGKETKELLSLASSTPLFAIGQLIIFDNPLKPAKAAVTLLSRNKGNNEQQYLNIKTSKKNYTKEYITLLRPYYLNL
jgi:tRNA1Val (adenine37-N6)-methyltransferase